MIVGRGSQHFLRDRNDALRFFLYASKAEKVRRLITEGKNNSEAEELVDTVDRERADFIKAYFHAEWPNRSITTRCSTRMREKKWWSERF